MERAFARAIGMALLLALAACSSNDSPKNVNASAAKPKALASGSADASSEKKSDVKKEENKDEPKKEEKEETKKEDEKDVAKEEPKKEEAKEEGELADEVDANDLMKLDRPATLTIAHEDGDIETMTVTVNGVALVITEEPSDGQVLTLANACRATNNVITVTCAGNGGEAALVQLKPLGEGMAIGCEADGQPGSDGIADDLTAVVTCGLGTTWKP